ncbi:F0F1 ATP synthase subunit alpha [Anaplasmataceae bacterium AB001_6]|nr:F0F1 ATP synthase subunit alpha [Anaplasmataceae bacterium AB001_6]
MDLKISEIESIIREQFQDNPVSIDVEECGRIISVKDGVVVIYGMKNVGFAELIKIDDKHNAMVQKITELSVEATLFCKDSEVQEGMIAKRTKEGVKVPVGEAVIGRVLDPLGHELDNHGSIETDIYDYIEKKAPGVMDRKSVHEPLQTGIKVIDSLVPIGRGQRELIVGNRQTGKTSIAIDTILNQRAKNKSRSKKDKMYCIYVAIGQKCSSIARTIEVLRSEGAMDYTTIIAANASSPATLQYIAPYTACTMGEYFRDNGMHCLIVYDDLSKHAVAYREISLLLRRPPGREAYPGDVFYLHSRLLERAAKMSDERGAGSLTALPIVETQAGDISAYIPTNVISITDGQIFLETELFNKGVRPALNVGTSVSRVGSAAQTKAMKKVSGSLKLELAQFREKEAFLQFSSDMDDVTKRLLKRGQVLTELLKQGAHSTMNVAEQAVTILMGTSGSLDDMPVELISDIEQQALLYLESNESDMMNEIEEKGDIVDREKVLAAIEKFKASYANKT